MHYTADLHIHSLYSRATSKTSHLHGLAAWAAIKGIDVVGTGDFTHPGWLNHLLENLVEAEPGFFRLKDTRAELFRDAVPAGLAPDISRIRFVLTSEISSIYKRGGKVRKVHNILFAPDFDAVRRINAALSAIGNLESDGRPILGLDSRNLLETVLEKAPLGFLVPAHIWTPWFSLFGSKSGFDSIEECFGDLSEHIFALETGLSSDPAMNRTISALDRYSLISNSDCHSPAKLGREANMFSTGFDFFSLRDALREPSDGGGKRRFEATIEFYPEEGKYHCDGHRKCGVCMEPRETRARGGICPACGRPLTVGVLYRVMELADRATPVYPAGSPVVHSLVPLTELLGELLQVGPSSKKVMQAYVHLVQRFGSEFAILLTADPGDLADGSSSFLAEAVKRVRTGNVIRRPGYDGEFGVIRVFTDSERKSFGGQMNLFGAADTGRPGKRGREVKKSPLAPPARATLEPVKKKELNPEQQQVVASEARHILVKAGPGTGKTHTLVHRLGRIAADSDVPCTVITFTNKAANELRDRLRSHAGDNPFIHVSTMHGYCLKWLRLRNPEIKVAGQEMRRWLLRSLAEEGKVENVPEREAEIAGFLQQAPDLRTALPGNLAPYFAVLEAEGLVDIDAVVPEMAALLYEESAEAEAVRRETGALFIDEFQDLNRSQYEVVRLLAETSAVFAIGDPDQAIYGFRGSSPVWFYRFVEELHPQQFSLYRNYRSAAAIVEAANQVIRHNPHPGRTVDNESFAARRGKIFLYQARSPHEEAGYLVRQIEKLIGGTTHREVDRLQQAEDPGDVALRDIAVLYRTTRQADILASSLYDHGFPVQVVDIRPYYLTGPVQPLYLWLLLVTGHADTTHLLAILKKEPGIGKKLLREVEQCLPMNIVDVLTTFAALQSSCSGPLDKTIEKMLSLRHQVRQTAAAKGVMAALQLLAVRYTINDDEPDFLRFLRLAENFASSPDAFAQHLLLHNDSVVYDERAEAVTLMTLHAAKGLEFKVVFIVGLEEGLLPFELRRFDSHFSDEQHLEEERRLFYVGMTRAEDILYLSHVQSRKIDGMDAARQASRFLQEMPSALLIPVEDNTSRRTAARKIQQLSLFK